MQLTKQKQKTTEDQVVEETPDGVNEQSAKVSEDAACCLAEIDALLEDCDKPRELTDQEIYDKGRPTPFEYGYPTYPWQRDEYFAAYKRFKQAYENVTGTAYNACTC